MQVKILKTYRRHMKWPTVSLDVPLFVQSDDMDLIQVVKWTYRKREKATGYNYEVKHAELDGKRGFLVTASYTEAAYLSTGEPRVIHTFGQALYDWASIKPGETARIPSKGESHLDGLFRSITRFNRLNRKCMLARVEAEGDGAVFVAYRRKDVVPYAPPEPI